MRGPDSDGNLNNRIQFRASDSTAGFVDDVVEMWGLNNRSEALRIIVHSWAGLLRGNFWAITDQQRLSDEWGAVGELLASSYQSDRPMPAELQEACLLDVIDDIDILLGAAEQELGLHPPDTPAEVENGGDLSDTEAE